MQILDLLILDFGEVVVADLMSLILDYVDWTEWLLGLGGGMRSTECHSNLSGIRCFMSWARHRVQYLNVWVFFFLRFYRSVTVIYNQLKNEVSQTLYISCSSTKSLQTFKPFNQNLSRSASLFLCSTLLFLLCSLTGHEGSAVFHCWEAADPPQGPAL